MKTVTSKDGTPIAYTKSGEGAPLLLVDGAMCYRAFGPMGPLAASLAPHFTVYTYDRRGRGESGDTLPYAVEREVEDMDAIIQAAGGAAFVYGISSGAALALEAAIRGLNITRLALYEPPYMVDQNLPRPPADYLAQLKALVAAGRRGDAVAYFMTKGIGMPEEAVAPMRNSPVWPMFEAIAPTLVYDATIMEGNNWQPPVQAASVTVPTLVMEGGDSPAWAGKASLALEKAIPDAQHRTLAGQTHEVAAEALAPALEKFFL
jgi:pimeloyl-ACP methyl ester carboxylesterase